jgi:hypothetical protein
MSEDCGLLEALQTAKHRPLMSMVNAQALAAALSLWLVNQSNYFSPASSVFIKIYSSPIYLDVLGIRA